MYLYQETAKLTFFFNVMYKFCTLHLRLNQTRSCCLPKALDHSFGLEYRHTDRSRALPYSFLFIPKLAWGKSPSLTTPLISCDTHLRADVTHPFRVMTSAECSSRLWHHNTMRTAAYWVLSYWVDIGLRAELLRGLWQAGGPTSLGRRLSK